MTPSKEQIEAWHDDATLGTKTLDLPHFARAAFTAGRRAGMEEAANICEGEISGATEDASRDAALLHCIRQIRAAIRDGDLHNLDGSWK